MTTKENVREKTLSLLDEAHESLIKKLDILLDSGAINFEDEDNNYKLPKHIMQALGDSMIRYFSNPHASAKDKKQIYPLVPKVIAQYIKRFNLYK